MNLESLLSIFKPLIEGTCEPMKAETLEAARRIGVHLGQCEQCRDAIMRTHEDLPMLFRAMIDRETLANHMTQFIERAESWEKPKS